MRYKWKPNKAQKEAYIVKCREKESLSIINTNFAIRNGCKVEYYSLNKGKIIKGTIINSSYGSGSFIGQNNLTGEQLYSKGQHTFTILKDDNTKILVKGRNLYPNLLKHEPGEESLKIS